MSTIEQFRNGVSVLNSHSDETATNYLTACSGKRINAQDSKCPRGSIIKLRSLTIYASTDSAAINAAKRQCLQISQCKRVVHNADDFGLSETYLHLYNWFSNKCQGKSQCGEGSLPKWWALTGNIKDDAADTRTCPNTGTKYFTGVLLHIECVVGEDISTVGPPPNTPPQTRPTTPTTTTAFPVFIPIYLPGLEDREKIILALAIGLAIAMLIVLLIILYCCERYRNHKNFLKLLRSLGGPRAQDNYDDDDDYSKTETWTDDHINPDALGEYTGVKPDEFLTMTKQAMESTRQIMYDTTIGTISTGRRNSCSTLTRNNGYNRYPSVESAEGGGYVGPMVYDTEENLDLERRMAAVLDIYDKAAEDHLESPTATEDNTPTTAEDIPTVDGSMNSSILDIDFTSDFKENII